MSLYFGIVWVGGHGFICVRACVCVRMHVADVAHGRGVICVCLCACAYYGVGVRVGVHCQFENWDRLYRYRRTIRFGLVGDVSFHLPPPIYTAQCKESSKWTSPDTRLPSAVSVVRVVPWSSR